VATFPLFEVESLFEFTGDLSTRGEFNMIMRIWHGAIPAAKGDEYLNLMRTVAIPDHDSRRQRRLRTAQFREQYRTFPHEHLLGVR
jgi:hypothetical protein